MSSLNDKPRPVAPRLGYILKRTQHALRTQMDDALRPLGITTPQYAVLCAIELEPGLSNAALARAGFVTAQTMQGIVANMERDGLLGRSEDPAHGRILRTELTSQGREMLVRAHVLVARVEAAMVHALTVPDVNNLIALLVRCTDNLASKTG